MHSLELNKKTGNKWPNLAREGPCWVMKMFNVLRANGV